MPQDIRLWYTWPHCNTETGCSSMPSWPQGLLCFNGDFCATKIRGKQSSKCHRSVSHGRSEQFDGPWPFLKMVWHSTSQTVKDCQAGSFQGYHIPIFCGPAITWEVSIFLEMFEQKISEFLAFSHFRIAGQSVFMSFRGGINHQFCQGRFKWSMWTSPWGFHGVVSIHLKYTL